MTADQLRQDADRRERLAQALLPLHGSGALNPALWRAFVAEPAAATAGGKSASIEDFVAAHDPPSALAACERDRLLADAIALLGDAYFHPDSAGPELRQKVLARFAALEVPGE